MPPGSSDRLNGNRVPITPRNGHSVSVLGRIGRNGKFGGGVPEATPTTLPRMPSAIMHHNGAPHVAPIDPPPTEWPCPSCWSQGEVTDAADCRRHEGPRAHELTVPLSVS